MSRNDAEGVAVDRARKQIVVEIERLRIDDTQSDSEANAGDGAGTGKHVYAGITTSRRGDNAFKASRMR
jgi:hypothetical protein